MAKKSKVDSRETGLELGLILGKFLVGTEDLHYGCWTNDMEVCLHNFAAAQANHSMLIISHIPEGVRSILDVGAGAGNLAAKLTVKGYQVDCVSPSEFLANRIESKLNGSGSVYRCKYEDLDTDKRYDLILFSESFQYVNLDKGFAQSANLLNAGGHILICDFFQTGAEGKNPLKGGHLLSDFNNSLNESVFNKVLETDITKETAPTIAVLVDFLGNVAPSVRDLGAKYLYGNYPKLMKLAAWKFRKRFGKINDKYLSRKISVDAYLKFQTYRLMLLEPDSGRA